MKFTNCVLDRRRHHGRVRVEGSAFACTLETNWATQYRGVYPRHAQFGGVDMSQLRFGFVAPWEYILDIDAAQTDNGLVVTSQGYQSVASGRIPFMRIRRFFWNEPEMLYEVIESKHMPKRHYIMTGIDLGEFEIDSQLRRATVRRDGVSISWQFQPRPICVLPLGNQWAFEFESPNVEALIQWNKEPADAFEFASISEEIGKLSVTGPRGDRHFDASSKHECVEPDERIVLPPGEAIFTASESGSCLAELAVRRVEGRKVRIGAARVFKLESLAETRSFPMFKPSLVRSLRSLRERMSFNCVTEDDPSENYQWGPGTWPRCLSVLSLDRWGFSREAMAYLEYMLDVSQQFVPLDGDPHLWDCFLLTGSYNNDRLYDLNAHSMKLYEAGKLYLAHRKDEIGEKLRGEHFETLRRWCVWIERHIEADGALLDETESNLWAFGFGAFSQAPAAAGVKLFTNIARDAGREDVARHFDGVVKRLMDGLNGRLWGDAANSHWNVPEGAGSCYLSYVPAVPNQRSWGDTIVKRIGISCYSLAAPYFLQDPDVGLLAPDDERAAATIDLTLKYGGDQFDPRITTWHTRRSQAHMGYGPSQMLQSLLFTNRFETCRDVLSALFEVSTREVGDIYLMQEVLGNRGNPNRGNKASLGYFPFFAALLAGRDTADVAAQSRSCIPDLLVRSRAIG